jgi:hypothetical protein
LGSVTKSNVRFEFACLSRQRYGDRDERVAVWLGDNNVTIQENSQDLDCFSRIIAKTDLGTEGT